MRSREIDYNHKIPHAISWNFPDRVAKLRRFGENRKPEVGWEGGHLKTPWGISRKMEDARSENENDTDAEK